MDIKKGLICLMVLTFAFTPFGAQASVNNNYRTADYNTHIESNRTRGDIFTTSNRTIGVDVTENDAGARTMRNNAENNVIERNSTAARFDNLEGHWAREVMDDFSEKNAFDRDKYSGYIGEMSRLDAIMLVMSTTEDAVVGNNKRISLPFADASAVPVQYRPIIEEAYAQGIIHGEQEGSRLYLRPNRIVTHAELATMLSNAHTLERNTAGTHSVTETPAWAFDAYTALHGAGALEGRDTATARMTRSTAIDMIYSAVDSNDGRFTSGTRNVIRAANVEDIEQSNDNMNAVTFDTGIAPGNMTEMTRTTRTNSAPAYDLK